MSIAPRDEEEVRELIATELAQTPEIVQPDGWAQPRGYSNGAVATGRFVTVAGQIGWNPLSCMFDSDDFAAQTRQALHNVVDVLLAANARPALRRNFGSNTAKRAGCEPNSNRSSGAG